MFVVCIDEVASSVRFPEIEAVCCPRGLFIPMIANLAESVVVPPIRKSCVVILGIMLPLSVSNGEPPFAIGSMPVTSAVRSTRDDVRRPPESTCIRPVEYPLSIIPFDCPFLPERSMSPVVDEPRVSV